MRKSIIKTDKSIDLLLIRLSLGIVMFPHGAQKVLGWFGGPGFEKTIDIFTTKMYIPVSLVIVLMITELFGGICLVLGLLTRVFATAIGISIAICAYMNHIQNGFFMNWFGNQKGEGIEFHILVIGIAIALAIKGGGLFSIDSVLSERKR